MSNLKKEKKTVENLDVIATKTSKWVLYQQNGLEIFFVPEKEPTYNNSTAMWTVIGDVPFFCGLNAQLKPRSNIDLVTSISVHEEYIRNIHGFPWRDCKGFKPLLHVKQYNPWGLIAWDLAYPIEFIYYRDNPHVYHR